MAALRAGVRRGAGMRRVPPWLAVLLVTGYSDSIVSLMGLLTKETCLTLSARCRLWLMRPRLLRMGRIHTHASTMHGTRGRSTSVLHATLKQAVAMTQMLFFNAATQKPLTTFVAGLALTIATLPKTSLLPAFVAGFMRVLIMTKPGMVNLPDFFTSLVATSAKPSSTFLTCAPFKSLAEASSATIADFDIAAAPFIAAAFIASAFARGAIV